MTRFELSKRWYMAQHARVQARTVAMETRYGHLRRPGCRAGVGGAALASSDARAMTTTSMPPLPRTMSSKSEPRSRSRHREWSGLPTTIRLTFLCRANVRRASATVSPERAAVAAPRSSANFIVRVRACRSVGERSGCPALST